MIKIVVNIFIITKMLAFKKSFLFKNLQYRIKKITIEFKKIEIVSKHLFLSMRNIYILEAHFKSIGSVVLEKFSSSTLKTTFRENVGKVLHSKLQKLIF